MYKISLINQATIHNLGWTVLSPPILSSKTWSSVFQSFQFNFFCQICQINCLYPSKKNLFPDPTVSNNPRKKENKYIKAVTVTSRGLFQDSMEEVRCCAKKSREGRRRALCYQRPHQQTFVAL